MDVPATVRITALAVPGMPFICTFYSTRSAQPDFQDRWSSQMLSHWVRVAHRSSCHACPGTAGGGHRGLDESLCSGAMTPKPGISQHTKRQICPCSEGAARGFPSNTADMHSATQGRGMCNTSIWMPIWRADILPSFLSYMTSFSSLMFPGKC